MENISKQVTKLIFYFRLELMLPTIWFKTMNTLADRLFKSKKKNSSSHPCDLMHIESVAFHYAKTLEKMPQKVLINRILKLEERK